ncbi:MAG TPA: acetylglutamate kinase [Candidatus Sulfomarinibacteraceae bacterium]|nr:acetylglutamate kinase [Candidatus Sulfomarinibacteraceae bacterium]
MLVLKIGGNELADPEFRAALGRMVATLSEQVILVHGGGQAIAQMQARLGIEPVMVDGLRVTDAASLEVAQMVLSGHTNKLIVTALLAAGVTAVGISGVDGGLLRCAKKAHDHVDLGLVGEIVEVNDRVLRPLLQSGVIPVISPISLGPNEQVYNVNADEAAGALAAALQATTVCFVSNVPAVLDENGKPLQRLTANQVRTLIEGGVIRDGMIPKVTTALAALENGVPQARIVNLEGLANGAGTTLVSTIT